MHIKCMNFTAAVNSLHISWTTRYSLVLATISEGAQFIPAVNPHYFIC